MEAEISLQHFPRSGHGYPAVANVNNIWRNVQRLSDNIEAQLASIKRTPQLVHSLFKAAVEAREHKS